MLKIKKRQDLSRGRGFTLIELTVTVALVGLLAWVTVPLFELTTTRVKEVELRSALRQIRTALDAYKAAADAGAVSRSVTESGYPPSLELLATGIETPERNSLGKRRVVFLRQIPRDPFFPDQTTPPAKQWLTRPYGGTFEDSRSEDIFDVASRSNRIALNGTPYREW
jgi:general secretion pathway protein G